MMAASSAPEQWVDIIPPAAPAFVPEPWLLLVLALGCIGSVVLAYLYLQRPHRRARRRLRRLAGELRRPGLDARPACMQVQQCLRTGLGQQQLPCVHWPEEADRQRWQAFTDRLARACFAAASPPAEDLQALVREAMTWLRKERGRV